MGGSTHAHLVVKIATSWNLLLSLVKVVDLLDYGGNLGGSQREDLNNPQVTRLLML